MNRINLFHTKAIRPSTLAVSPASRDNKTFENHAGVFVFAALLIACSLAVGCSSEKPKQVASNQTSVTAPTPSMPAAAVTPTPETQAAAKPLHKRAVRHVPTTLKYVDKDSGVSFRYPRKYILKTGDAADELVSSNATAMDFSQPGGVVTAAVAIPEGAYPKSDLVSAMFDVSVNKSLTEEQCNEFPATAQPDSATPANAPAQTETSSPKMILGDMELTSAETVGSAGTRKEASKYYHVFENGACYEFALKVATTGVEPDEGGKPVDNDEVFKRLETILATVKISPVETEKQAASVPVAAPTNPAQ